jgi:hypothetical protein
MLHLLPIRYLLAAFAALVAIAVLTAAYAGVIGKGDALADLKWIIHWSSTAALTVIVVSLAAWRWIRKLQSLVFPYLGGEWVGELNFNGQSGAGTRPVNLTIYHSIFRVALILESAESTSRTLVVQADRDFNINRDRLYYVYLNERKEGVSGAGDRYRGLAILRVESSEKLALRGDYFTERQSIGTLSLIRQRSHPWWALWK